MATTLALLGVAASFAGKAYGQIGQGLPVAASSLAIVMGLNLLEVIKFVDGATVYLWKNLPAYFFLHPPFPVENLRFFPGFPHLFTVILLFLYPFVSQIRRDRNTKDEHSTETIAHIVDQQVI